MQRVEGIKNVNPARLEQPLWAMGLPRVPEVLTPVCSDDAAIFHEGNREAPWEGRVYLDGSGWEADVPEARRCGWAVAMVDDEGGLIRGMYGPLPGLPQTVPRAEHYALKMLMESYQAGATAATDCQATQVNYMAGDKAASHKGAFASMWRMVRSRLKLHARARSGLQVVLSPGVAKARARRNAKAVDVGRISCMGLEGE